MVKVLFPDRDAERDSMGIILDREKPYALAVPGVHRIMNTPTHHAAHDKGYLLCVPQRVESVTGILGAAQELWPFAACSSFR